MHLQSSGLWALFSKNDKLDALRTDVQTLKGELEYLQLQHERVLAHLELREANQGELMELNNG